MTEANSMDSSSAAYQAVEALADEFMERKRRGEQPTIDEYVERHPDLASEIREVFPALAVIEQIAPASVDLEQSQISHESPAHIRVSQIGDYRILREIGRGGMGVVYEAEQQSLRRRVALKVLPRQVAGDDKSLKRFQQEARAAARMHHTNIVPVFEVGDDEEHEFYAMQLIQGQGLDVVINDLKELRSDNADHLAGSDDPSQAHSIAASLVMGKFEQQKLIADDSNQVDDANGSEEFNATVIAEAAMFGDGSTPSAVLPGQSEISAAETDRGGYYLSVARIGHQTAGALSHAHVRGIFHRDIKPSNLLLDTAGVVWVTDFGLAKTGDEALTHTGDILGTLRYMSPERFQGKCDGRADIYSLGLTLYELLVLRPAFSSPDRLKLIEMVSKSEPPTPRSIDPRIPRDLETIVLKSIDKDPRRRYQSADDLSDDLERFIQDEPIHARRISLAERLARWSRRHKSLAASLALVFGLLLVISIAGPLMYLDAKRGWNEAERKNGELEEAKAILEANEGILTRTIDDLEGARSDLTQTVDNLEASLYHSAMQEVRLAFSEGSLDRVQELLARYIPLDDEEDLRDADWYYWWWASHRHQQQFGNRAPRLGLVVSPDRTWAAAAVYNDAVNVYDYDGETLESVRRLQVGASMSYFSGVWVSPDGRLLGVVTEDQVKLWSTEDWSDLPPIPIPTSGDGDLRRMAFSPAEMLAVGDDAGHVSFWDINDRTETAAAVDFPDEIVALAFSPDGARLAVASFTGLYVVDVQEQTVHPLVEGERFFSSALTWSQSGDDNLLVAGFRNGEIRIYNGTTLEERPRLHTDGHIGALAFSADQRRLAAGTWRNMLHVWDIDLETGEFRSLPPIHAHARSIRGVRFLDESGETIVSCATDGTVRSWSVSRGAAYDRLPPPPDEIRSRWRKIAFDADGRSLCQHHLHQAGSNNAQISRWTTQFSRWNVSEDGSFGALIHSEEIIRSWHSDNGRFLVVCRQDDDGLFWEVTETQAPNSTFRGRLPFDAESIGGITVSNDGSVVACVHRDTIHLFHTADGGPEQLSPDGAIYILALSANGDRLARYGANREIELWDISGKPKQLQTLTSGTIFDVRFSPDGKYFALATWGNDVELYDALTGEIVHQFVGHSASVREISFSEDGRLLASCSSDGTVRIWDVAQRIPFLTFPAEESRLVSVAFSPDGGAVASVDEFGEVRIRRIATEERVQQYAEYWIVRADRYEERGEYEAAVDDLTRAIDLRPLNVSSLLERRIALSVRLERWHDAAVDYEQLVKEYHAGDSEEWQRAVTLHAVAYLEGDGEINDYQRICNAMIEHFQESQDSVDIERTMKCCALLDAESETDKLRVERVTDELASGISPSMTAWFNLACALSALRSGDFPAALQYAEAGLQSSALVSSAQPRMKQQATLQAIRSLASERSDDAENALAAARQTIDGHIEHHADGSIVGASALWPDGTPDQNLLIAEILIREAEAAFDR